MMQARNCTEADVNLALQREEFSKIAPCAGKILTPRSSAELRIRVAAALLEAGQSEALSKLLRDYPQQKAFRPRQPTGARVATKNWQPQLISSSTRQTPIRIACIS